MKSRLIEHLLGIVLVSAVLLGLLLFAKNHVQAPAAELTPDLTALNDIGFVDLKNPFQKALLKDVLNIFYPGQFDRNNAAVESLAGAREKELRDKLEKAHVVERLSGRKFGQILFMYAKFMLVYLIVMLLTYYGVQTMAVWRFCRRKGMRGPRSIPAKISGFLMKCLSGIAAFILFCPAYVIAYSIRTELNTDTVIFMTILCVISNGLLIVYANKFYALLVAESRRGYVETAVVKNLNTTYERGSASGISLHAILSLRKKFSGHVFDHIYRNARFQYLSTIKEQASFLITGMIITEMALNIHGHLSYEMLRQMLYGNYSIVIVIILGIFYAVKATEIVTDYLVYREGRRYQ
jgi:hypothetical protein